MRLSTAMLVSLFAMTAGYTDSALGSPAPIVLAQNQSRAITSGELVRVKKLLRDMQNVRQSIPAEGPSIFQNVPTLRKYEKRFGQFTDAIKCYADFDHAEVAAAKSGYLALRKALADEHARAKQQAEGTGDEQGELRAMEAELHAKVAPAPLRIPFNEPTATQWVAAAVAAKLAGQAAVKRLPEITQVAKLEKSNAGTVQQGAPYDLQDIGRLQRLAQGRVQQVDEARDTTMGSLKSAFDAMDNELEYFRKLDPEIPSHRANAFLKEGAAVGIHERLNGFRYTALSAKHFLQAMGQPASENVQARLEEIRALKDTYDTNLEKAAGAYTLPAPASSDAALLAIALEIIERPKYGFGSHGPLVLTTAEVVDREREESEAVFDDVDVSLSGDITLTGTETTWTYRWQEFKFATPVRADNGNWHVWWITARNYSSGGGRTPIGQWVAGKSVQGSQIQEGNF